MSLTDKGTAVEQIEKAFENWLSENNNTFVAWGDMHIELVAKFTHQYTLAKIQQILDLLGESKQ